MDQQVLQVLRETLSPEEAVRQNAEVQLKQLFFHPEAGLSLSRILLAQDVNIAQRQSAGVLLQQYILKHWSGISHVFEDPSTPNEIKAQIRPIIFSGLSDPQRKIRMASAFALSTIARFDWPDEYPDLLSSLVGLLHTGSPVSVHGSMRVIAEFVKNDLSEDQLLPVVRDLLPALLQVLGDSNTHSYTTRSECVATFRQVLRMLETVREEHPAAVKQALEEIGDIWLGAFRTLLSLNARTEVEASWDSLGLRIEIFRTLTTVQSSFPRLLTPHLPLYLSTTLSNLTSLLPTFQTYYLSSAPDAPEPPSPTSDAGFVVPKNDLDDMACAAFDFVTPLVRLPKMKGEMISGENGERAGGLAEGLEEEWLEDANAFVMDDDEETEQYGLRTVGINLIGAMMDKYPRPIALLLQSQTQQIVSESAQLRQQGVLEWWKPLEAVLATLGGLSDDIRDRLDSERESGEAASIDLGYLFDQVIPRLLDQSDTPFLQGRAFVFASHFASLLPEHLATQYLAAAVSALQSEAVSIPVKISAVKTIKNFCRFVQPSILHPQTRSILSLLLPLLGQTTGETLYLLLETVRAVVGLDQELLTPDSVLEVTDRIYETWEANTSDPVITAITEELFEALASRPLLVGTIVTRLSPRLAALIGTRPDEDCIHVPGEAVQLANSLIRSRGGPVEVDLINGVTGAVVGVLAGTDDMDVIQVSSSSLLTPRHAADGTPGLTALFHLLARFLSPSFSESGGIFTGELIMHLFRKAGGSIGDVLPGLLRAVVGRLASAKLPSFIQSLVLPFAYLFETEHTVSTIDLLSQFSVPTPDGSERGALDLVLNAWCETCETISGSWNIRVSDLGMAKLFLHPDPRVSAVAVRGEMIVDASNRDVIMTRSKARAAPPKYTQIPFPVKALKLLLKDLQALGGKKGSAGGRDDPEIEEDDGDEDWDDDDPLGDAGEDEFQYLSSWLENGQGDSDTQDDDEDLRSDPIAQIDLSAHLTDILRGCYTSNANGMHGMVDGLTEGEKGILRGVLTL
ncbi:armadillo-type protein [Dioszegia hungarica]|uniref:Armadillo-type protein n=1 Tax=Dioszegia hungarica TaxID=4972 RepID=A0AA38HF34_9TREE|nr:armadillo-type protein [Dioszegia hungarica]KAI9638767.1 armadillo-type protein [Dioszegia hungarica]